MTSRFSDFVYRRTRFATVLHLLLVISLGLLAYSNTFTATFNFDDIANILGNPVVRNVDPFADPFAVKGSRAVGDFTFAVNYRLNGLDVFGYHLVNLAIHLATALLVYTLVTLTFRTPLLAPAEEGERGRFSGPIALFAALLFVAHPLQTQAVTYIVQRFTSLAAMFYIGSLVLYIMARLEQGGGGRRGKLFAAACYLLSLLTAVLAMKTKEIAFTLPFTVILYEFMFFRGSIAKRVMFIGAFLLTLAIIPLSMLGSSGAGQLLGRLEAATMVQTEMPRLDYLFTQFRVIVTYLRLLFFPVGQNLDHDFPVAHSFFNAPVFLSFLLLLAIFGVGIYFVYRSTFYVLRSTLDSSPSTTDHRPPTAFYHQPSTTDHRPPTAVYRLTAFGIFWFFIALAVESSVIPIVDVIFEHRVYLPSIGFFMALSTAVVLAVDRLAVRRPQIAGIAFIALLLVAVSLATATFRRNMVWQDETTLWQDVAAKSPDKSRPWNNLAYAYLKKHQPKKAIPALIRSIGISPGHPDAWNNIGIALGQLGTYAGRYSPTYELFDASMGMNAAYQNEWFALGYNNLGLAYDSMGQLADSIDNYEKSIAMNPRLSEAHYNLGLAYAASKETQKATDQYVILKSLNPEFAAKLLKSVNGDLGSGIGKNPVPSSQFPD
ncbi:tetratricopeptide repeat protein [Geotalea uraniireducens]|uniref:Tetratricopeptide TPR_2 repeat protein n=1 Tax=Geotalea uraniireducens (strain Rf4) TaxID=351605 RepID=A5G827_GEOUR|nr:tetratricopeptide repeat protein [Geotalea uraniireducens]ABQ27945.1 Tetratricopeptide TPR_2 repeat protein [Geotalea uraniireducens Rf4]